ncbi:MAG TPA: hypothetical protein VIQ05_27255 [Tardiphaga sp.]
MRKSTLPLAVAIAAALSLPAHAAKFTCTFYNAGNPVKQCGIEPLGTQCSYSYNANLAGACAAGRDDNDTHEGLSCAFGNPSTNVADVFKDAAIFSPTRSAKPLSEKPGFATQALSIFETGKSLLFDVAYRESTTSPIFEVQCQ